MKTVNFLPNVITTFGLTCGLFVIYKTNMIDKGGTTFESLQASVFILLLAAIADFMDGAVARALRAETEFGAVFDSLSDAVTFGVAPCVLTLKTMAVDPEAEISMLVTSGAMVFSICGILRLVRFSVAKQAPKSELPEMAAFKKHFEGLPIPAAASMVLSMTLFMAAVEEHLFTLEGTERAILVSTVLFALGYLMVTRWQFPSLKAVHIRMPSFQLVFVTVAGVVLLFYGMMYHFASTLLITSWSYLLIAGLLGFRRMLRARG